MKRNEQIKQAAIGRYGNNGNESQYMLAKIQAFMVGARYADEHPNGSQIKWQTGEPKEDGKYLITVKGKKIVYITTDFWDNREEWTTFLTESVVAWCKLSDIEPYKEE